MFKQAQKSVYINKPSIYDIQGKVTFEQRQNILLRLMHSNRKLVVKGGNSETNPYKIHYDVVISERLSNITKYEDSILWSPQFTPTHFKWFIYPAFILLGFLTYLRFIAWPKYMVYLKQKYGLIFPDLEAKGWLKEWLPEKYENYDEKEMYEDWTFRDIIAFEKDKGTNTPSLAKNEIQRPFDIQKQKKDFTFFQNLYDKRKNLGVDQFIQLFAAFIHFFNKYTSLNSSSASYSTFFLKNLHSLNLKKIFFYF